MIWPVSMTTAWLIKYSFSKNRSNFVPQKYYCFQRSGSASPLKIFSNNVLDGLPLYIYRLAFESNRAHYPKIYTWPLAKRTIHLTTKTREFYWKINTSKLLAQYISKYWFRIRHYVYIYKYNILKLAIQKYKMYMLHSCALGCPVPSSESRPYTWGCWSCYRLMRLLPSRHLRVQKPPQLDGFSRTASRFHISYLSQLLVYY